MGVRAVWGSLELVSCTVQSNPTDPMALSAQAEELRQSISALYGGTRGVSRPHPVPLSTRSATPVDNGGAGCEVWK